MKRRKDWAPMRALCETMTTGMGPTVVVPLIDEVMALRAEVDHLDEVCARARRAGLL